MVRSVVPTPDTLAPPFDAPDSDRRPLVSLVSSRSCARSANHRQIALIEVVKLLSGLSAQLADDRLPRESALLNRGRTDPRHLPPILRKCCQITDRENLGMTGNAEIGLDLQAAGAVGRG